MEPRHADCQRLGIRRGRRPALAHRAPRVEHDPFHEPFPHPNRPQGLPRRAGRRLRVQRHNELPASEPHQPASEPHHGPERPGAEVSPQRASERRRVGGARQKPREHPRGDAEGAVDRQRIVGAPLHRHASTRRAARPTASSTTASRRRCGRPNRAPGSSPSTRSSFRTARRSGSKGSAGSTRRTAEARSRAIAWTSWGRASATRWSTQAGPVRDRHPQGHRQVVALSEGARFS